MASKALPFLSLIVVLLIASEVVARDLAEKSAEYKNNEGDEVKQTEQFGGFPGGGYGGNPGGGYGNRGGGYGNRGGGYGNRGGGYGNRGGGYGNRGGGYGNRGGGYCRYGCCYRGYYGGCSRCCSYAGQAVQTQPQSTDPGH